MEEELIIEEPVVVEEEVVDDEEELVEDEEEYEPTPIQDVKDKVVVKTWNGEVILGVDNRIMNGRLYKDVRTVQATYLVSAGEFVEGVIEQ